MIVSFRTVPAPDRDLDHDPVVVHDQGISFCNPPKLNQCCLDLMVEADVIDLGLDRGLDQSQDPPVSQNRRVEMIRTTLDRLGVIPDRLVLARDPDLLMNKMPMEIIVMEPMETRDLVLDRSRLIIVTPQMPDLNSIAFVWYNYLTKI